MILRQSQSKCEAESCSTRTHKVVHLSCFERLVEGGWCPDGLGLGRLDVHLPIRQQGPFGPRIGLTSPCPALTLGARVEKDDSKFLGGDQLCLVGPALKKAGLLLHLQACDQLGTVCYS